MTISLPGSSKRSLSGLFGRKKAEAGTQVQPKKKLEGHEVARLFDKKSRAAEAKPVKPAKLNDTEKQDRERLSNLRGALYSQD
ncbi:hypothetical protein SLH49_12785 [Cognatiyoonia sp. IB215446]|uniref:hypothetical protein n=1 Tax=Cognatiyoonia sp. IB215446 TaxID=3097355 RepID=UPI002A0E925F|nr:hypothetical protein [Cognatiyoonia sp. IB215446]MDX8348856.1 hypothetical protein [Cognatiyoonia sp. IB215446]